jgi:hypothetical protein
MKSMSHIEIITNQRSKTMTLNKLASLIAKREGKKSQVKIGDVREILRIIVEIEGEDLYGGGDGSGMPLEILTEATNKWKPKNPKAKKSRGKG